MTRSLSLRTRLTLWYTLVLVVVLGLFAANVVIVQRRIALRGVDDELEGWHATVVNVLRHELDEHESLTAAAEEAGDTVVSGGMSVAVLDPSGATVAARVEGIDARLLAPPGTSQTITRTVQTATGEWRVRAQPVAIDTTSGTTSCIVLLARPLANVDREQRGLQQALLIGIPIALLLAGAGGLWLASVGLRPISDMARQAGRIRSDGAENLGDSGRTDELGQLARAFNDLLARVRMALGTQRQFMADASHELRTPVSVVRTAADVALSRDHRQESEYRETLGIVGDQARRLSRLVEDMLVLARADAGGYVLRPVDLYLDEIVAECRRAADVLAVERGVTIHASSGRDVPYRGDEMLMHRMLLNVIQNAVQHTPAGGSVGVDLRADDQGVTIRVTDTGPGIPPGDRAKIFDRFVQLDAARRGSGTGLGLPIAKWIAEAHRGSLALESSGPSGSSFRVWLPAG